MGLLDDAISQAAALADFRRTLHRSVFTARADSLTDLSDAVLTHSGRVDSLPELSLEAAFRRQFPSVYDALANGRIDRGALERLLTAAAARQGGPPVFALDESAHPRRDAETLPERELVSISVGDRHLGCPGFWYSTLAQVDPTGPPWAAPVSARRSAPGADRLAAACTQVREVLAGLPDALLVCDAGYPPGRMVALLSGAPIALLVRVRSDRVLYRAPTARPAGALGRPRRYGERLEMASPGLLPPPDESAEGTDRHGRPVAVAAWHEVTAKPNRASPAVTGSVLLVSVGDGRMLPLRLFWSRADASSARPDLLGCALAYLARFDIEHLFRFLKRTLGWRAPALGDPAAVDRWTSVLLACCAQIALARPLAAGDRLPWQRPVDPARLSPGRVRQQFSRILAIVGTPAGAPKPVTPGRGSAAGRKRRLRKRQEVSRRGPPRPDPRRPAA